MTTMLFTLREAAKKCPDKYMRHRLKETSDELYFALNSLAEDRTEIALQHVVGLWARGTRQMLLAEQTTPGGNGGSLREEAKLAA